MRQLTLCPVLRTENGNASNKTQTLTVYCSVDEAFARPILNRFEATTQSQLAIVFDTEAGKTTGLVNRIIQEDDSGRPRADVFWSSEVFNTIALARRGLLVAHRPSTAKDIPARFKDPDHYWTGLAVRARVIAYNTRKLQAEEVPTEITELALPRWKGRVVMARPSFGTTGGHVASWFALFGPERAKEFLRELRENDVRIVEGNSQAVRAVAQGQADLCLTDTDDVWAAQRNGWPVDLVYPRHDEQGTLLIPNTVARVRGGPNPEAASQLIAYLLSSETERALAESDSHNIPVSESLAAGLESYRVESPMALSYRQIAEHLGPALRASSEILEP